MDWHAECKKWHDDAIRDLKTHGHTPFMLRIYPLATDNCVVWIEPDGLDNLARVKLRVIDKELRTMKPAAILFRSDLWAASTRFWKHHGLENVPYVDRNKRYLEILHKEYGGSLGNAPKSVRGEAISTIIKGPNVLVNLFTVYERKLNGKIVIDKTAPMGYGDVYLISNWWEQTIQ